MHNVDNCWQLWRGWLHNVLAFVGYAEYEDTYIQYTELLYICIWYNLPSKYWIKWSVHSFHGSSWACLVETVYSDGIKIARRKYSVQCNLGKSEISRPTSPWHAGRELPRRCQVISPWVDSENGGLRSADMPSFCITTLTLHILPVTIEKQTIPVSFPLLFPAVSARIQADTPNSPLLGFNHS